MRKTRTPRRPVGGPATAAELVAMRKAMAVLYDELIEEALYKVRRWRKWSEEHGPTAASRRERGERP